MQGKGQCQPVMDWAGHDMKSLKIEQKIVYECMDLYVKM